MQLIKLTSAFILLLGVCHANLQRDSEVSEQPGDQVAAISGNRHNHELFPSSSLYQTGKFEFFFGVVLGVVAFVIVVLLPIVCFCVYLKDQYEKMKVFKITREMFGYFLLVLIYIVLQILAGFAVDLNAKYFFVWSEYYVGTVVLIVDYAVAAFCIAVAVIYLFLFTTGSL
jgi:hypothetical protein